MALLPFLAAGQTHREKGPYKKNIEAGLFWLVNNQKPDGDLSAGSGQTMYTHGLATICMCEAYGLSQRQENRRGGPKGDQLHRARRRTPAAAAGIITARPTNRAIPRWSAGKSWRSRAASWPAWMFPQPR